MLDAVKIVIVSISSTIGALIIVLAAAAIAAPILIYEAAKAIDLWASYGGDERRRRKENWGP